MRQKANHGGHGGVTENTEKEILPGVYFRSGKVQDAIGSGLHGMNGLPTYSATLLRPTKSARSTGFLPIIITLRALRGCC